jgi:hypothetical protein
MLDDELRALTSVEPSPEFRARVRTAVANDNPPRGIWWRPLAVAGAAVMFAAIVWATSGTWREHRDPQVAHGEAPSAPAAIARPETTVPNTRNAVNAVAPPVRSGAPEDPPVAHRHGQGRVRALQRPETTAANLPPAQIDPREAAALRQLFTTPVTVRIVEPMAGAAASGVQDDLVIPELSIAPLVIEGIEHGNRGESTQKDPEEALRR